MMDPAVRATAFARLLALGFVSPHRVVAWVDSVIAEAQVPSEFLIDASLSEAKRGELITALERYGKASGRVDSSAIWSAVLAGLHAWFRDHPEDGRRIAEALYQMAVAGELPSPEVEGAMYGLADEYELAWNGVYGKREAVDAHLQQFLSRYAA